MWAPKKFLYYFDLEVGGFVIGMMGFTTSFILNIPICLLLYYAICFSLFKLYVVATLIAYYMFASFLHVREIFCDVRDGNLILTKNSFSGHR
jgi:hypothetical protein